jgi:hypothetical protein
MLFFRSEDMVEGWCKAHACPVRPLVSIPTLWSLAQVWYSTRLSPLSRRPQPDEMREIFGRLGLTGEFWDPQSDAFG